MRTRNYKADLEELEDEYQDARDDAFNDEFVEFITGTPTDEKLTFDDVQGFLDSFTFPDVADWCASEYESRRDSYEDAKYEEMKEAKWEQEDEEK